MNPACGFDPYQVSEPGPGAGLGLGLVIGVASAFALALSTYSLQDPAAGPVVSGQPAPVEQLMEWRPQGPPPGFDADQMSPEEVEEPTQLAAAGADDSSSGRGGDLRARPER